MDPAAGRAGGLDAALAAARSWIRPPAMRSVGEGFEVVGYDASQRAYVWRRDSGGGQKTGARASGSGPVLKAVIDASAASPIENLSLIVEGWDSSTAEVFLDGRPADRVRSGRIRGLLGDGLAVWIELRSTKPVALEMRGGGAREDSRAGG
jgi:hypothetical protein